jgi:hypothetical protein
MHRSASQGVGRSVGESAGGAGRSAATLQPIPETNRVHLALFGMQNRTFDPYLAANNRILISLMSHVLLAGLNCSAPIPFDTFIIYPISVVAFAVVQRSMDPANRVPCTYHGRRRLAVDCGTPVAVDQTTRETTSSTDGPLSTSRALAVLPRRSGSQRRPVYRFFWVQS